MSTVSWVQQYPHERTPVPMHKDCSPDWLIQNEGLVVLQKNKRHIYQQTCLSPTNLHYLITFKSDKKLSASFESVAKLHIIIELTKLFTAYSFISIAFNLHKHKEPPEMEVLVLIVRS